MPHYKWMIVKTSLIMPGIFLLLFIGIQPGFARPPADTLSENARISLLTIYPGDELYSTFGHNAIRIVDPLQQMDRLYNYGTFDFEEPGFYFKFARGQLDYQLSAYSYQLGNYMYRQERRSMIEQVLNLTPDMKNRLYRFLEWNYLPENRRYRYDFFFDNCATRIRDAFEKVLNDDLHLYLNRGQRLTFRQYIDLYTQNHPFSNYGMDLGLGNKADRIATPREILFLPDFLYQAVAKATIRINGETRPFVVSTDTLLWFEERAVVRRSPPWPAILFWLLCMVFCLLTYLEFRSQIRMPKGFSGPDFLLFGAVGLAGLLILFLWFATDHKVTPNNWDLLWTWPTHLLILIFFLRRKKPPWLAWYFLVNAAMMVIVLAGWKFWPQDLHPASIPLVISLGVRSGWWVYRLKKTAAP